MDRTMRKLIATTVAAAALASYYLVERPALRIRPRLERRFIGKRAAPEVPDAEPPPAATAAAVGHH